MPRPSWSKKEERQYKHIKRQAVERGSSEDRAEEIAARTVNKQRAQAGETEKASRTSTEDMSAYKRGGRRSGKGTGPQGRTKEQLYEDARRKDVKGRSKMNKAELQRALERS
ncbi:plasmid stabilization protein [Glycomyces sp. L485]|uniref:plasmid stabilization protein n=1 Tax=Glycomyces sp. L485 TaxID=2909235 RepID=UPI001F4A4247|nr:plasmid stabilization protein [Glycomyces sp. L485]MCH7231918.1 plasmid stabilization protein [Glycomyces sp. L485]